VELDQEKKIQWMAPPSVTAAFPAVVLRVLVVDGADLKVQTPAS